MKKLLRNHKTADSAATFLYVVIALNIFILLDIMLGILSIVLWIITKDAAWGYTLGAVAVVYFLTYAAISFFGVRLFKKELSR